MKIPRELIECADRVIYACRRWGPDSIGMRMTCADCGAAVAVTPTVLADRRRQVHAVGRSLAIVCDDCALDQGVASGAMVAAMPTAAEIDAANAGGGGE